LQVLSNIAFEPSGGVTCARLNADSKDFPISSTRGVLPRCSQHRRHKTDCRTLTGLVVAARVGAAGPRCKPRARASIVSQRVTRSSVDQVPRAPVWPVLAVFRAVRL